jgi:SPP1 family predicted phage head-tail adaptor
MSISANVDARRLTERVTFRRRSVTQDPTTGDPVTSWTSLGEVWASVDATKASERWQDPHLADATQTVSDMTIWIRADVMQRLQLRESDAAIWRDRHLDIVDVLDQQLRGRLTAVICREGLNDG